jgi:long-chain acyl-CoA synthetase
VQQTKTEVFGVWNIGAKYPDRTAIVNPDGAEVTAGELVAACNQVAHGLRTLGLRRGDSIAVMVPSNSVFFELFYAAMQIGLYFTPINYNLTGSEVAYILDDCEAKVFVTFEKFGSVARQAVEEIGFPADRRFSVGDIAGFRPYAELKSRDSTPPDDRSPGIELWYTSGTTGRPKGVRRPLPEGEPYQLYAAAAERQRVLHGMEPGSGVHLLTSPIYHGGPQGTACGAVHSGQAVVLMERFSAEKFLELVDRYQVTSAHMVPTMFVRLLGLPEPTKKRYDLSSLHNIVHAAAPCPPEVKQQMLDWWGPIIYEYYAATEGGGTFVKPDEWLRRPGTVGQAMPGAEIRILDDDGNRLPAGVAGNVYMKSMGPVAFKYFKDDEKTKSVFRDGFFTVGDVGYLDDEGWLFLTERKPDIIISGGVNIYPAEIEAVLVTHPSVGDAAVIGVPDDDRGEQVMALIEPAAGAAVSGLEQELAQLCRERLAPYKHPRSYQFRETLNRTEAGKLQRRLLREEFWAGRDRRI